MALDRTLVQVDGAETADDLNANAFAHLDAEGIKSFETIDPCDGTNSLDVGTDGDIKVIVSSKVIEELEDDINHWIGICGGG